VVASNGNAGRNFPQIGFNGAVARAKRNRNFNCVPREYDHLVGPLIRGQLQWRTLLNDSALFASDSPVGQINPKLNNVPMK
jgi:hypothetical protein